MHQAGGKCAETAERTTADLLMRSQRANGSWLSPNRDESNYGYVYATTLAVLSLSVRYHYLPIYQR